MTPARSWTGLVRDRYRRLLPSVPQTEHLQVREAQIILQTWEGIELAGLLLNKAMVNNATSRIGNERGL